MSTKNYTTAVKIPSVMQKENSTIEKEPATLIPYKPIDTVPPGTYQIVGPGSEPANDPPDSPYNNELNGGSSENNESGSFLSHVKKVNAIVWGGIVLFAVLVGLSVYMIAKQ